MRRLTDDYLFIFAKSLLSFLELTFKGVLMN